ncbi:MAG: F0F1 ATP synthase subunit B [Patescibacteria group bacterium]|nr:F0F1 ATP synthase subunit B [Patescibacteria group bacterium]
MEVFTQLGIKPLLLVAQIINFLILMFLLKRFLYKPILKMLDDRKKKIEESMQQAKDIEQQLQNAEKMKLEKQEDAKKQASKILDQAKKDAEMIRKDILTKSDDDAKRVIKKATDEMKGEKEKLLSDVKKQAADLTMLATQTVLKKGLDEQKQRELIGEAIKEIDNFKIKS